MITFIVLAILVLILVAASTGLVMGLNDWEKAERLGERL